MMVVRNNISHESITRPVSSHRQRQNRPVEFRQGRLHTIDGLHRQCLIDALVVALRTPQQRRTLSADNNRGHLTTEALNKSSRRRTARVPNTACDGSRRPYRHARVLQRQLRQRTDTQSTRRHVANAKRTNAANTKLTRVQPPTQCLPTHSLLE